MIHIFGGSGLIGKALQVYLKRNQEKFITYGRRDDNDIKIDLMEIRSIKNMVKLMNKDIVVNLAAIAQPRVVFQNKKESYQINVNANKMITKLASERDCKYFYMSSVEVFGGKNKAYAENDSRSPLNEYGIQKLTSERFIQQYYPNRSIIGRTSWNTSSVGNGRCFVEYMKKMITQTGIKIAYDNIFTISESIKTAEVIYKSCKTLSNGNIHIASPTPISRLEVADYIKMHLDREEVKYERCRFKDLDFEEDRSQYNILDTKKSIQQLGIIYREPIEIIKDRLNLGKQLI